jgi:hypothetical protein
MKKFTKLYNEMHGIPNDEEEKETKKEKVPDPLDMDSLKKQLDELEDLKADL